MPGAESASTASQGGSVREVGNQQIKSMLADAARFLQQAMPEQPAPEPNTATPIPGPPQPPSAKAQPTVQGTPVTLASLSAQLESIRALAGDPGVRAVFANESQVEVCTMKELLTQQCELKTVVQQYEARLCSQVTGGPPVALLDSGATHPVVAFEPSMTGLEKVPVTLAGDAKQEWVAYARWHACCSPRWPG